MTFNVRVLLCLATIAFVTATVQSNTRTFDTRWDSTPIFKQVKGATDLKKSSHLDLTPFIQSGDYKAAQLAAQLAAAQNRAHFPGGGKRKTKHKKTN